LGVFADVDFVDFVGETERALVFGMLMEVYIMGSKV
jgi:hypothetical protein